MSLDDYTWRVRADAGDTTVHNEVAPAEVFAGGAPALVSDGSGGYAWEITGEALAALTSYAINPASDTGGATLVVRLAVVTPGGTDARYAVARSSSTINYGLGLHQASSTTYRGRYRNAASIYNTATSITHGSSYHTLVIQLHTVATAGSYDQVQMWESGGAGGESPDHASALYQLGGITVDQLVLGASGSIIRVSDLVFYPHGVTGAEARALVDDLRGTLDGGGAVNLTGNGATGATGAVTPQVALSLTGANATCATGNVTPFDATAVALTGNGASGYVGSAVASAAVPITGVVSSGAVGTVTPVGSTVQIVISLLADLETHSSRPSEAGATIFINSVGTNDLIATLTDQTFGATGATITHASLVDATDYRVTVVLADGTEGTHILTAAAS